MGFANRRVGQTFLSDKNEGQERASRPHHGVKRHLRPKNSFKPRLEPLEDRLTPAVFNAVDASMLIADIIVANSNHEANTINLTPNFFYVLTGPDNSAEGFTGLPVITSPFLLTINGNQAKIERQTPFSSFRLFNVASGAALSLNSVTLESGSTMPPRRAAPFSMQALSHSHTM
jgi:hypothetical protein